MTEVESKQLLTAPAQRRRKEPRRSLVFFLGKKPDTPKKHLHLYKERKTKNEKRKTKNEERRTKNEKRKTRNQKMRR